MCCNYTTQEELNASLVCMAISEGTVHIAHNKHREYLLYLHSVPWLTYVHTGGSPLL